MCMHIVVLNLRSLETTNTLGSICLSLLMQRRQAVVQPPPVHYSKENAVSVLVLNWTFSKDTEISLEKRIAPFPIFSFQNKLLKYFTSCIFFLHLPKVFQKKFLSLLDKFTLYWTNIKVFFIHVSICLMTSLIFTVQSTWGQIWYSPLFCVPGHYASYSKKSARLQELFSWFDLSKVLKGT